MARTETQDHIEKLQQRVADALEEFRMETKIIGVDVSSITTYENTAFGRRPIRVDVTVTIN